MMSLGIWVNRGEDYSVKFIYGKTNSCSLGISEAAKKLTSMLVKLGEKITDSENMKTVRQLLKQVVNVDIIPELEKERELFGTETYKIKDIIGDTSLADIKTVIKKGKPTYFPKKDSADNTCEVLSLDLDPTEKIMALIERKDLVKLGISQP